MSFLYKKKKQYLNSMKMIFETLNKLRQFFPYLYTCKLNKMALPWRYPLNILNKYILSIHYTRLSFYTIHCTVYIYIYFLFYKCIC